MLINTTWKTNHLFCCIILILSWGTRQTCQDTKLQRARKGVAANVAASASSKTQRVPLPTPLITSSRVASTVYEDPPLSISDAHTWRGLFTAEEKLVAQLLSRGSLTVRPNGYQNLSTNPVHVDITYNVVQILGFSQAEETLSISGWFTLRWQDPRLTWDPETFSDIQEVSLPSANLWIPDVGVMNGKASTDFDFSAGVRGRVTVSSDGSVTWLHGAVLDVTCPLDVSFFPFDYQTCFLILTPWQSGEQQLLLEPFTRGSAVDNSYLPNSNVSEWEIQSVHFVRRKYRSDLNVTYQYVSIAIHLKRQPLYFVVLVLVPFSMLSALACLIFTLDDTGDRLSVALSLVLSMTMYVVIVSTNAPRSMRTLPVLGIFLLDQLGLLSIATILAVMNNKLCQSAELIRWQDLIYTISGTGEGKNSAVSTLANKLFLNRYMNWKPHRNSSVLENPRVMENKQDLHPSAKEATSTLKGCTHAKHTTTSTTATATKLDALHPSKRCMQDPIDLHKYPTDVFSSRLNWPNVRPLNESDANSCCSNEQSDSPIMGMHKLYASKIHANKYARQNFDPDSINPYQRPHHYPQQHQQQIDDQRHGRYMFCNNPDAVKSFPDNCTSCAIKARKKAEPRSPWVEHLTNSRESDTKDRIQNETDPFTDPDSSSCDSIESSPSRMFETTVTATAAAALAATKVLAASYTSATNINRTNVKVSKLNTVNSFPELFFKKRHAENNHFKTDKETQDSVSRIAAAAAVNAAFEAATRTCSMGRANRKHVTAAGRHTRKRKSANRNSRKSLVNESYEYNPPYPYRKLAARLDCIQMITYLFLSTINAIACLILMPRYSQDSNPPAHWIS